MTMPAARLASITLPDLAPLTAIGGIVLSTITMLQFAFKPTQAAAIGTDIRSVGRLLMDTNVYGYALPFEVISILLLAALVGSIFIARKDRV